MAIVLEFSCVIAGESGILLCLDIQTEFSIAMHPLRRHLLVPHRNLKKIYPEIIVKNLLKNRPVRIRVEAVVLFLGCLFQIYLITHSFILPSIGLMRDTQNLSAQERSAVITFGDRYAKFVSWILENTPEDAVVLLPPEELDYILGHVGVMQFYLIPRQLSDCPQNQDWNECMHVQRGENTYILAIEDFPPVDELEATYSLLPFDEEWGIYVPESESMP